MEFEEPRYNCENSDEELGLVTEPDPTRNLGSRRGLEATVKNKIWK